MLWRVRKRKELKSGGSSSCYGLNELVKSEQMKEEGMEQHEQIPRDGKVPFW